MAARQRNLVFRAFRAFPALLALLVGLTVTGGGALPDYPDFNDPHYNPSPGYRPPRLLGGFNSNHLPGPGNHRPDPGPRRNWRSRSPGNHGDNYGDSYNVDGYNGGGYNGGSYNDGSYNGGGGYGMPRFGYEKSHDYYDSYESSYGNRANRNRKWASKIKHSGWKLNKPSYGRPGYNPNGSLHHSRSRSRSRSNRINNNVNRFPTYDSYSSRNSHGPTPSRHRRRQRYSSPFSSPSSSSFSGGSNSYPRLGGSSRPRTRPGDGGDGGGPDWYRPYSEYRGRLRRRGGRRRRGYYQASYDLGEDDYFRYDYPAIPDYDAGTGAGWSDRSDYMYRKGLYCRVVCFVLCVCVF